MGGSVKSLETPRATQQVLQDGVMQWGRARPRGCCGDGGEAREGQVWGPVKYQKCLQGIALSSVDSHSLNSGGRFLFQWQASGLRLWASPTQMVPHGLNRIVFLDSLATKR